MTANALHWICVLKITKLNETNKKKIDVNLLKFTDGVLKSTSVNVNCYIMSEIEWFRLKGENRKRNDLYELYSLTIVVIVLLLLFFWIEISLW